MTVTGEIKASGMGVTLPHEHVLFDLAQIDSTGINRYNKDSVIRRILPLFEGLKPYKVKTFVDGTPEFMGRDPQLLAELSRKTGINIITNTGWYAAENERHLPKEVKEMSAEEIALIWISEAKNGIGNTGIKPGFINLAISKSELSETDKKLVAAACLTHLETGLSIVSLTGPALGALEQLQILKKYGVDPSAFIWLHAMEELSRGRVLTVAEKGAWVALDGIQPDLDASVRISEMVKYMKSIRRLDHVLLSHDSGGYQPGLPGGGNFRPYTELFDSFTLLLLSEGITQEELNQMMVKNPAEAFGIRVRKIR
ncbi:MAG: phosphotriesterase [Bacteroidetes bacterium]|nr:phosphotriesterase [Bacteroidota bacterium]